jgi:hypothetical protein
LPKALAISTACHHVTGCAALQPHVCICLMSASMPPFTDDDLKRLGVAQCFSKPMELSKLVAALKKLPVGSP